MGLAITTPTSFWRLEEASGTRIDSAAGGNDLNLNNGAPGNTVGKIGNALSCVAASSQYVAIADNASLSMGSGVSFSFSCWVKFTALGADKAIFGKANIATEYACFYLNSTQSIRFQISNGTNFTVNTAANSVTATGVWYFIACMFDGVAQTYSISLNGGAPTSITNGAAFARDSTSQFRIGEVFGLFADGVIDAVGFWKNYVLTTTDISNLYNGGGVALGTEYYNGAWQSTIVGGPFQQNIDGNFTAGMTGGYSGS